MIPIDRQVQQTMGAFRGQPDKLMQRYKQGNDLIDLLALQQMKSDMDAVKQQMVLSQQQMPGTIKDQREQEVLAGYKEKAGRQVGDVAKNTAGLLAQRQASANANMQRQGIMQPTQTANNGGLMKMAGGGIVGFAKGGITQEELIELGITPDGWRRMSDAEKQKVISVLEDRKTASGVLSTITDIPAEISDAFSAVPEYFSDLGGAISTTRVGKALGLSTPTEEDTDFGDVVDALAGKGVSSPAVEAREAERAKPVPTIEDIETTISKIDEAEDKKLEESYQMPPGLEGLEFQKEQQQKAAQAARLAAENKEKADTAKAAGVAALTPPIPAKGIFDPEAVKTIADPIMEKYGLADVGGKTFAGVRDEARAESDRYLDREGAKQIRQTQIDELDKLKQKQLDPETLKRDNILRGLISAAGGGNFAAVGQGIFNAKDAQNVQERNFLKEKFGIQDNLLDTDLEIAVKGIDSGNQAVDILDKQKRAAAEIVQNFSVEQLKDIRERSKQEFESGQSAIANRLKQDEINAVREYRKAVTDNQKLNVLIDKTADISTTISDTLSADPQLAALRAEMENDPDDQSLKEEYKLLLEQKQVELLDMINLSGLFDLVEQIRSDLGLSAQSGMQPNQFGPMQVTP